MNISTTVYTWLKKLKIPTPVPVHLSEKGGEFAIIEKNEKLAKFPDFYKRWSGVIRDWYLAPEKDYDAFARKYFK